jgi:uncharacterized protein (DUF362 family)
VENKDFYKYTNFERVVSVVKSENVEYAVNQCIKLLGGIDSILKSKHKVLIKPNFCGGLPWEEGSITNLKVLITVAKIFLDAGFKEVFVGEADGSFNKADWMFNELNLQNLAEEHGFKLVNLSKGSSVEVSVPNPLTLKTLKLSKVVVDSLVVSVPVLKTHPWATVTLNLKNMFGITYNPNKFRLHSVLDEAIVDINKVIKPVLCIIDGIVSVKNGKFSRALWVGNPPIKSNLIIAGLNPVATDAVGAKILGYTPAEINHIKLATQHGLGNHNMEYIKVKGEPEEEINKLLG